MKNDKVKTALRDYLNAVPEHVIQQHFIQSLILEYGENGKKLVWFSIPNGTKSPWTNKRNKATGMLAGAPDMFIGYQGAALFLEFKSAKGVVRANQKTVHNMLQAHCFYCAVVRSSDEALEAIANFIKSVDGISV